MKKLVVFADSKVAKILGTISLSVFLSLQLFAQDVFNSANVIIQSGVSVTSNGSWNNSGFIINNGSIALTGDWDNSFVYQGLGYVSLTGVDQLINNNRQSFNTLSIAGGGIKTIKGSFSIDKLIKFQSGIVHVAEDDTLRLFPAAEVEGASSISYIDGAVIAMGTGYKFLPIGKNGKYHPLELLDVTGITPVLELEVQENLPPVSASLPATPFADIYWTQKSLHGTYEGSPVAVRYNVPDNVEADRLVLLEGNSLSEPFTARETKLQQTNSLDLVESRQALAGSIIALAALNVEPPREHYFSTTLSPNASNPENRVIRLFGDNVTSEGFRFQVFNRWGSSVYETTSANTMITEGWDGRQNGNMLQTGVYPYSLGYVDTSGKPVKKTGFITIIQ